MGLIFRKRVKVDDNTSVNLSTSGASVSRRVGRVTINSRGGGRIRIAPGLSFRFGKRR
jgi:hypothetical protein